MSNTSGAGNINTTTEKFDALKGESKFQKGIFERSLKISGNSRQNSPVCITNKYELYGCMI